jgi:small subunit ribosomal protein S17
MTTSPTSQPTGRMLKGVVVSDKMTKTIVVEITRLRKHDLYKKYRKISTRYKVHDESNQYHVGDTVIVRESRPLSKTKRWVVVEKVS